MTVRARACSENGFDYCLDVEGSSHGVRRYFSKREWQGARGFEALLAEQPAP